jgi:FtsP/CotA-like multicopper oxidase with cupredoxin domain
VKIPHLLLSFVVLGTTAASTRSATPYATQSPTPAAVPVVVANDNRTAAGTLKDGVLTLRLVVSMARWYPEANDGAWAEMPVFAEEGKAPSVPGPLIRVPVGTRVRVSVRNALGDSTLLLFGMIAPESTDSVPLQLRPGATHAAEFRADAAGTFLYAARYGSFLDSTAMEHEQLAGAIVVDAPGERTDDRVLVMNIWSERLTDSTGREVLAINGKGWPHTERFDVTVGDSLRWRVVNASMRSHPMHLHGAYFRVDARGTALADTVYAAAQRRMAVTERMLARTSMRLVWSPEEPGNWLFHCHLAFHVIAAARLEPPKDDHAAMLSHDPAQHMAGLVTGISVRPRPADVTAPRANVRPLTAYVLPGVPRGPRSRTPIALTFARSGSLPPADSVRGGPGDVIVLTRGEPTDITVHNRLTESTSIHWHGLELESWSDGVAGWSGQGPRVAPAIAPNDSFVARLTLKRAGTFIYHTHLNDIEQLVGGLYGAIVVLEPGERWDPARDLVFVGGWGPAPVVNGGATDAPVEMGIGETVRLRLIAIAPANSFRFRLLRDSVETEWRAVGKDGFALPAAQAVVGPANVLIDNGETFDAEFTPTVAGTYRLISRSAGRQRYERLFVVR